MAPRTSQRSNRKKDKHKGGIRTGQLVTTYGVGALIASGDESFIVADLPDWFDGNQSVSLIGEPRLQRLLGVRELRRPPSSQDEGGEDIPVRRFPMMQSCPDCHRLDEVFRFGNSFGKAECEECASALVPSRFVVACDHGHLDEFPYFHWVHADKAHDKTSGGRLTLRSTGTSGGLESIIVRCSCGATRSMAGAFGKVAMRGVRRCQAARPWAGTSEPSTCDRPLKVLQRGASNVWFSTVVSALSIPPWTDSAFQKLEQNWPVFSKMPLYSVAETIEAMGLADEQHSVDDLTEAVRLRRELETVDYETEDGLLPAAIKREEYEALVKGAAEESSKDQFVCLPAAEAGSLAHEVFDSIRRVTRLRIVQVLTGFSRIKPVSGLAEAPDDSDREANNDRPKPVVLDGRTEGWLPAVDVIGEGVFLGLSEERLVAWEANTDVVRRVEKLHEAAGVGLSRRFRLDFTPRGILVHTLAHALIGQWSLDAGYPEAALAERLYVDDDQAGMLIYTATGDSAGSLGGVVALAEGGRLDASLVEAIRRVSWCSADPLCVESTPHGADSKNLAACHACVLLPEVSCEQGNQMLDRALLVGTPENPELGFFNRLLTDGTWS